MANGYRRVDRAQQFLLPPSMLEWLPSGHLAWFLIDVVAQMDTAAFHLNRARCGRGRAAYDPDMLVTLLIYAYCHQVRSSRRIERLCQTDVAFRVICAQDAPDHCTIARFRQDNEEAFTALFSQVLGLCARAGMGRLGSVAIDGTRIAANASAGANRSQAWLRDQVADMVAEADRVDAEEDEAFGDARGDELPEPFADPAGRAARIREALGQAEAERDAAAAAAADAAANQTARAEAYMCRLEAGDAPPGAPPAGVDPMRVAAARLAREQRRERDAATARRRADAAKAARAAAQAHTQAAAQAAAGTGNAGHSEGSGREPEPGRNPDKRPRWNITDPDSRLMPTRNGGWIQGYNAQLAVTDDHLILAVDISQDTGDTHQCQPMTSAATVAAQHLKRHRPPADPHNGNPCHTGASDDQIGVLLFDAGYLSEDNLTAPGPDRLIATGTHHDQHRTARDHPTTGPPPADATPAQAMRHRLATADGHTAYLRRGATVEPVIGHLKDHTGLRQFSRRGLTAALAELNLAAATINLLKLWRTQHAT